MATEPFATVLILTRNGGPRFREVIRAVAAQEAPFSYEILVVDSESTDGTPEAARAAGARVLTIPKGRFEHGATRNLGVAAARGRYVALLTQDARPLDARWLARLVAALEARPTAAGAYGRQVPTPEADPFVRDRLARWAAARTERVVQRLERPESFWAAEPLARLEAAAFDNVAACVRRAVLAVHPFPRRRFGEDVAWALEVLLAGYEIVYEPDAVVEHAHREGLLGSFRRVYRDHQNLSTLLGVVLVPDRQALWRSLCRAWGFYRGILARAELPRLRRFLWTAYALPYGWGQALAQYLGARSNRWRRRGGWGVRLDRWLGGWRGE